MNWPTIVLCAFYGAVIAAGVVRATGTHRHEDDFTRKWW